jgi:hypothetical protein
VWGLEMRGAAPRQSQLATDSCRCDWHVGRGGAGSEAEANSVGGAGRLAVARPAAPTAQHAQWQVVALSAAARARMS